MGPSVKGRRLGMDVSGAGGVDVHARGKDARTPDIRHGRERRHRQPGQRDQHPGKASEAGQAHGGTI